MPAEKEDWGFVNMLIGRNRQKVEWILAHGMSKYWLSLLVM